MTIPVSEPAVCEPEQRSPWRGKPARIERAEGGVQAVFVIGPPRTGTTLLSYLLAGGPRVLSLSEPFRLHEVFPRWGLWWTYRRMGKEHGFKAIAPRMRLSDSALLAHLKDAAARNAMSTVVVKETFRSDRGWANLPLLETLVGSGEPVVTIIRHPFDCAVSTLKMFRLWRGVVGHLVRPIVPDLPLFAGDADIVEYVARTWCDFARWCEVRKLPVVRYEDLVREPGDRLQTLCERCGILFDPRMLDPNHPRGPFGGIGDPGVMTRTPRPVSARSVGCKKQLPPRLQRILKASCGPIAESWSYDL